MLLRFTKMHGLGNDLMVLDLISQHAYIQPQQIRAWSDRRFGVGFQRLALIEVPRHPDDDFSCRMFNAEGIEIDWLISDLCCVARLVADKRLISKAQMRVAMRHAVLDVQVHLDGSVSVPVAPPEFNAERIVLPNSLTQQQGSQAWLLENSVSMLSMDGSHAVLLVKDLSAVPMAALAAYLEQQPRVAANTTLSAVQVHDASTIEVLTWLLGEGAIDGFHPSLCASAASVIKQDKVNRRVRLEFANGQAKAWMQWLANDQNMYLTGASTRVYEGQIRI